MRRTMAKAHPKPVTSGGLVRKCCYLDPAEARRLRRVAFEAERSESDLMREAVAELLDRLAGEVE
jgi:hypothetical protein